MPATRLTRTLCDGASLHDDELRALWRFRTGLVPLKPSTDPEADFSRFSRRCRASQYVLRYRDAGGEIRGMGVAQFRDERWGDECYLVVLPEYGFLDPAYRRDPEIILGFLSLFLRLLVHARGRPIYGFCIGYLQGFKSIDAMTSPLWTLGDPDVPPLVRDLLERGMLEIGGDAWDRATHRVALPTLPRAPTATWWAAMKDDPGVVRYLSLCPDWLEGKAIGFAGRGDLPALVRIATRWARRRLRV